MSSIRRGSGPVDLQSLVTLVQNRDAPLGKRVEALKELASVAAGTADVFEPNAQQVALQTLQSVAQRVGDKDDYIKAVMAAADGLASVKTQSGDAATESFLMRTLPRPNSQWEVINDLAQRADLPAQRIIVRVAREHPHPSVRHEALKALGRLAARGEATPRQAIADVVKNEKAVPGDRVLALEIAAGWSRPGTDLLLAGLKTGSEPVQRRAVELLEPHVQTPSVREALTALAQQTPSAELKRAIEQVLAR